MSLLLAAALFAPLNSGAQPTTTRAVAVEQDKVICKRQENQADLGSRLRGRGERVCKKASEWKAVETRQDSPGASTPVNTQN